MYPGTASFFKRESQEELSHANQIEDYLLKRGVAFHLQNIAIAQKNWQQPLDIFEDAYKLECEYKVHLEKIVGDARKVGDELTVLEMAKMLGDQIDSCNEYEMLLNKARAYTSLEGLYYHLDHELRKKK